MDIIQLLEVLKPAKDVVTVQIASQKDQLTPWLDLAKAVLPAAATAGVAWVAMKNSHRQFEKNSKRQSSEFRLGIEQQIKSLRIQTQLATEVDLKKDICKNVRNACAEYLKHALELERQNDNYKLACEYIEKGGPGFVEKRNVAHELRMKASADMLYSKMILLTYLDPIEDAEFQKVISEVSDCAHTDNNMDVGSASGLCLKVCREYIARKHKEIVELTESIVIRD